MANVRWQLLNRSAWQNRIVVAVGISIMSYQYDYRQRIAAGALAYSRHPTQRHPTPRPHPTPWHKTGTKISSAARFDIFLKYTFAMRYSAVCIQTPAPIETPLNVDTPLNVNTPLNDDPLLNVDYDWIKPRTPDQNNLSTSACLSDITQAHVNA